MTRSPLAGASTANFTDELPELSTSTRPPESSEAWALSPVAVIRGIILSAGEAEVSAIFDAKRTARLSRPGRVGRRGISRTAAVMPPNRRALRVDPRRRAADLGLQLRQQPGE